MKKWEHQEIVIGFFIEICTSLLLIALSMDKLGGSNIFYAYYVRYVSMEAIATVDSVLNS